MVGRIAYFLSADDPKCKQIEIDTVFLDMKDSLEVIIEMSIKIACSY